ncbi:hypothetical protein [Microbulbifer yueqingensis]|uniref:hypothetical protein n=1 Tax=Microbulbifer yueqingensis TaxID=658219 RepID=UPI0011139247|nr:hypothetical protein [Microbulbifer yueqingensis]
MKRRGNPNFAQVRNSDTRAATKAAQEKAHERIREVYFQIREIMEQEVTSYTGIASELKKRRVRTANGGLNWDATRVRNIFKKIATFTRVSPKGQTCLEDFMEPIDTSQK